MITASEAYRIPVSVLGYADDQTYATAMVDGWCRDNWEDKEPTGELPFNPPLLSENYGIAIYLKAQAKGKKIRVWRRPVFRDEPARWLGVTEWVPKKASGWFLFDFLRGLKQWEYDLAAYRTPAILDYDPRVMKQADGTDGVLCIDDDATGLNGTETLNLRRLDNEVQVAEINAALLGTYAKIGDYVVDKMIRRNDSTRKVMKSHGFRGVGSSRKDGVVRAQWIADAFIPSAISMAAVMIQFGAGATFRFPAGGVEHPLGTDRNQHGIDSTGTYPQGNVPSMVPHGSRFALDITDVEIENWLDRRGLEGVKRRTARAFAVALRDYGWIIDETGHHQSAFEVETNANPDARGIMASAGLADRNDFRTLLDGLITKENTRLVNADYGFAA